ncbi:gfo/Idh/MocA family oxidoreductase [Alginatibacterium sediminis]|uniref:Gfo/Idh/MocA family oxidoreductase n=1 Tax=Alginatibacterium sediminis TaxID=2164068 RepID=A0A420EGU5_9ALTE|nr:Gfo/Idh/MocA family oxidoreductase [Alginatibacterium sediminis]RKF19941.1 gfo/Idh/MocA family oxidoreductase [Alginatibacterium sediminis]
MIRFAVIGSSWITESFISAAKKSQRFVFVGAYSRQLEKAQNFTQANGGERAFDNLEALANDSQIDAIYIASPNSLHFEQSMQMLNSGKHVICEKPLASNAQQVEQLIACAKANNRVVFEAFKTAHLPNFKVIEQQIEKLGKLRKAHFSYCQYSSRYDKYLNGENPNTFNPKFSNGSIMDIGYYCVASAVALFGKPKSINAQASLLKSGVDAHGAVLMGYDDFSAVVEHSKVSDGSNSSEIQGEKGRLEIEFISECLAVRLILKGQEVQNVTVAQDTETMMYEAIAFADAIENDDEDQTRRYTHSIELGLVLEEIRRQTGVVFPSDNS